MNDSPDLPQTFVFADLAGFTALTEAHGDAQAAKLAHDFCERVSELSRSYDAHWLKSIGDAVLLRANLAGDAVALGLAVVELTDQLDGYPGIRVGMHSGTAVELGGEWIGGTVNIAARVSAVAASGEVVLTEETKELAGPELAGVELESLGELKLRNLARPVKLHRARPPESAGRDRNVDPVCRMVVTRGRGVRLEVDEQELHFCSLDCAALYCADPGAYAGPGV